MNADNNKTELDAVTGKIIAAVYTVSNSLGHGFLEKVYENALCIELEKCGLEPAAQRSVPVFYDGKLVGDYYADIVVNDAVLLELKAVKSLDTTHHAQCMNYLKATQYTVCLLINFGNPKAEIKRIVNNF